MNNEPDSVRLDNKHYPGLRSRTYKEASRRKWPVPQLIREALLKFLDASDTELNIIKIKTKRK